LTEAQVTLIHMMRVFQHYSQDLLKWFYIPYCQGIDNIKLQEKRWELEKSDFHQNLASLPVLMMLPALSKAYTKAAVLERNIDALRCVEAIRMHAALNQGKLPQTLKEIVAVPVPLNPITGGAFDYKIEDGKAILEAKVPSGEPARSGVKYIIAISPLPTK
jgi:predicted Rdx family selenoprotein